MRDGEEGDLVGIGICIDCLGDGRSGLVWCRCC